MAREVTGHQLIKFQKEDFKVCVCVCVCACVRACMRVCVRVCVRVH